MMSYTGFLLLLFIYITESTEPNQTIMISQSNHSGPLYCYDCRAKFKYNYNPGNCISNVTAFFKPRKCQDHQKYCKLQWTKKNRIYTLFERNCVESCEYVCRIRGFGFWEETCTFCCDGNGCNYTNDAHKILTAKQIFQTYFWCAITLLVTSTVIC